MFAKLATFSATLLATGCVPPPAWNTSASDELSNRGPVARAQWAAQCDDWDDWDKPAPPFNVHGQTYYVGTCGIAAILILGDEGHVLIDSGTEAGAEVVLANLETLGVDPQDIEILLTSHEHFDHVGGMALLKEATGAHLYTSSQAAEAFRTGAVAENDPQFGGIDGVTPAIVDGIVRDGDEIALGSLRVTAIATPGHTPGALSWSWSDTAFMSDTFSYTLTITYADSLSPVSADGYHFSDHPDYVADYRSGLARLSDNGCQIVLTPHPSASRMRETMLGATMADGMDCAAYAADRLERLEARLAREVEQ